jgi:hypothetical protein
LEAVFVLLEFSSPSRRIFIGSHSLPPSLVRRIGPSGESHSHQEAIHNLEREEEDLRREINHLEGSTLSWRTRKTPSEGKP